MEHEKRHGTARGGRPEPHSHFSYCCGFRSLFIDPDGCFLFNDTDPYSCLSFKHRGKCAATKSFNQTHFLEYF